MPTIAKFFSDKGDAVNIAVKILNKGKGPADIYYCELPKTATIPPSVYVWAHCKKIGGMGKDIYTNYPRSWVNEYTVTEIGINRTAPKAKKALAKEYANAIKIDVLEKDNWKAFSLDRLGSPPNLTDIYGDETTQGESRARRLYMLAAFSILKKYGRKAPDEKRHNIGSILVSKTGTILSWGVNTGGFCHAEVNTILGYFAKNPNETRLPANSVLFSTLKPCAMCSKFIINAQHNGSDVKVWYGMIDEGKKGNTKLLGNNSTHFQGQEFVQPDMNEFWNPESTETSPFTSPNATVIGSKPVKVEWQGKKENLYDSLNQTGGGHGAGRGNVSAADWVDGSDDVWGLVMAASAKLAGKAEKGGRSDGPIKATLDYIRNWFQ